MFAEKKKNEADKPESNAGGYALKWKNPEMGTVERAREYVVRFLPDIKGDTFYEKYFYHGFTSGDKFQYILCEKTFGMDKYCPWCDANKMLYQGNDADKKAAAAYKRKERFAGNIIVVDDPRDSDVQESDKKVSGSVRLYEFPGVVESKLKTEVTDTRNGYGIKIFDPEDGYDFILKVKAKPKDKNGKEWPDYGDSMFSRRPSAIADSDDGIQAILDKCYNLKEYLNSMRMSVADHEKLLKAEMLWDDIEGNFERHFKGEEAKPKEEPKPSNSTSKPQETKKEEPVQSSSNQENDEEETEDLLKELEDM